MTLVTRLRMGRAAAVVLVAVLAGGAQTQLPPSTVSPDTVLLSAASSRSVVPQSRSAVLPNTVTFTPTAIPVSAAEIPNPLRGQYRWISNPADPPSWPAPDVYYRDEIQWGKRVETTRGRYDFSAFDRGLAAAQARNGLFSFRIMGACPGCGGNLTPGYVPRQSGGQPDWNSEAFLSGYENLMKALGARYDRDPRLGFVDVGGYGSWGEYHVYELDGEKITRANSKRLVRSVLNAFPGKYVMMMTPDPEYLSDALALSPRVGIRVDCIGADGLKGSKIDDVPAALTRWKTAPWIGEWCGSGGSDQYGLGLEQVRKYHISSLSSANFPGVYQDMSRSEQAKFGAANKSSGYRFVLNKLTVPAAVIAGSAIVVSAQWSNLGVGPAYLPWNTMIELRNPVDGSIVFAGRSSIDLKTFLPTGKTPATVTDAFAVPATLRSGSYDLYVRVVSPGGYLAPLNLAIAGRNADGGYRLGAVQVLAP